MKPRLPPRKSNPLVDMDSLRIPVFATWLLAVLFMIIGLHIPCLYVERYALSTGVSEDLTFYLLIFMNAASVAARIAPSTLANKVGNLYTVIPAMLLSSIVALAWIRVST
ncbi:hypothetical protein F5Y19DRAFT_480068 [Xylariaceae sp. FL1651]|nr:hypothetical protein F5Y19DRAFT_480068 [Xylariaceae sp. FL1651]